MNEHRRRVAIVGGGLSGVTAAYEFARQFPDQEITLFEASHRLGGIVETVRTDGFTIECGADSWLTEKPWARELAAKLGLADQIIPSNDFQRRTYIACGRELLPMPDGMRMMVPTQWEPVVHSPLLSWQARLGYLREPKRASELKQAALASRGEDADESVADFVLRHFGAEVATTLAAPLLSGVFGGDVAKLSVRAVMAPFVRLEAEYGSLIDGLRAKASADASKEKLSTFTSLADGLETLIRKMVESISSKSVMLNTKVTRLRREGGAWQLQFAGRTESFESVLLAVPAHATGALLRSADSAVASEIADLLPTEASSAVIVAVGFLPEKAKRLRIPRGFGFLVPPDKKVTADGDPSLLACTFVDQKFSHRVPAGGVLLRAFFGGNAAERLANVEDVVILRIAREQLSRLLGPLPEADVSLVRHWPLSLPQYLVGHTQRIMRAERLLEGLPGLGLLGNAYHGVGIPDMVCSARAAVLSTMVKAGFQDATHAGRVMSL